LIARSVILAGLLIIYPSSGDPLFLSLLLIVGLGFVLTGVSYLLDRRERRS
jgi:putative exporter of polyketide antibiotics